MKENNMARKYGQNKGESDFREVDMLKTGDELRAAANERVRRCRAKQAVKVRTRTKLARMMQFTITIQLPVLRIRREL
jgi:hypothetical protein